MECYKLIFSFILQKADPKILMKPLRGLRLRMQVQYLIFFEIEMFFRFFWLITWNMSKMHCFSNKFSNIAKRSWTFFIIGYLKRYVIWPNCGFLSWL